MTKLMHWTTEDWIALIAQITMGASIVRIALHWLRNLPLLQVIPATSGFWKAFDLIESTLAYISISLAAFGKKRPESTIAEPVVQAQSPAEGTLVAADEARPRVN